MRVGLIIEHMLYEFESGENYNFSYSDSEYMAAIFSQPADDSESSESGDDPEDNAGNVQNTSIQYNTEVSKMDVCWIKVKSDMPNFHF